MHFSAFLVALAGYASADSVADHLLTGGFHSAPALDKRSPGLLTPVLAPLLPGVW